MAIPFALALALTVGSYLLLFVYATLFSLATQCVESAAPSRAFFDDLISVLPVVAMIRFIWDPGGMQHALDATLPYDGSPCLSLTDYNLSTSYWVWEPTMLNLRALPTTPHAEAMLTPSLATHNQRVWDPGIHRSVGCNTTMMDPISFAPLSVLATAAIPGSLTVDRDVVVILLATAAIPIPVSMATSCRNVLTWTVNVVVVTMVNRFHYCHPVLSRPTVPNIDS